MLTNLLRVGTIAELDEEEYRVRVTSGDVLTDWISVLAQRAGPDKTYWLPEVGEQVLIFSPSGDPAQGYVLAGIFSEKFPPNAKDKNIYRQDFANGSYIRHDKKENTMHIRVEGDLWIDAKNIYLNDPSFKPVLEN
jgi:phage baseplate assembly protein V